MSKEQIQQIEDSIKENRKIVELGDALTRLTNSRDFKKVVLEGYFEKEAIRLVHLKASPEMQSEARQKAIISDIDSIGAFHEYLRTLEFQANMARKAIGEDEEMLAELNVEELQ